MTTTDPLAPAIEAGKDAAAALLTTRRQRDGRCTTGRGAGGAAVTAPTTRHCLGCTIPIAPPYICCRSCWFELPPELRLAAGTARRGSAAGLRAARAVNDWFRKAEQL